MKGTTAACANFQGQVVVTCLPTYSPHSFFALSLSLEGESMREGAK